MKYSKSFNRDYEFYFNNLDNFNFCGTLIPKYEAIANKNGLSAKECFYYIESHGVNKPCIQPELLNQLLLCKAGVNFQIKQWAEGIADSTLWLFEYSIRLYNERHALLEPYCGKLPDVKFKNQNLVWVNGEPVYYDDIETQYNCPQWVGMAVLNQGKKLIFEKA